MSRLFGTDGVRGIANDQISCKLAFHIGMAGASVLMSESQNHARLIIIGSDTRISGDMIRAALSAGICSLGVNVICVGDLPTPALAYLTRSWGADAGIMISASHNPMEYNGIKWIDKNGFKLPDEIEDKIEELIIRGTDNLIKPTGKDVGTIKHRNDGLDSYIEYLKSTTAQRFDGIKVVLDCANGASFQAAPRVFEELGASVVVYNNEPDGTNINKDCGSTHPEHLQKYVLENKADIGLAFDGDADRLIAVDHNGELVDGDKVMAILAIAESKKRSLAKNTLVTTVMSNYGLEIAMRTQGIEIVKTNVGDRYVLEYMRENGCSLGGEQSGHIIFLEHSTTGDGILTGIQLLSELKRTGDSLSEKAKIMSTLPQVLINAKVHDGKKHKYKEDKSVVERINVLEEKYHGLGRVLIRPSGTEPLVRVMIEGDTDIDTLKKDAQELADYIIDKLS